MRLISTLLILAGIGWGSWYAWENFPQVRDLVENTLLKPGPLTLEASYPAGSPEAELLYYPYLLMEVKYSKDSVTTCEGSMLWGLSDGEMVVELTTLEKTHGFEDCLLTKANKNDFKILKVLVENEGIADLQILNKSFTEDQNSVKRWLESCLKKNLIVFSENKYRLHFENPRFELALSSENFSKKVGLVLSENEEKGEALKNFLTQALHLIPSFDAKPVKKMSKIKKCYSSFQVEQLAQLAFGDDFAIRKTQEIYLPVYRTIVKNAEAKDVTVYINALNGKKLNWESP